MKNNKKGLISRLFASNIFLLILSFILSFTSWIVVSFVSDTNTKPTTITNIPVSIELPESEFDYICFLDKNSGVSQDDSGRPLISADVKGNAIIVGSLTSDNINVTGKINIPNSAALSPKEYLVSLSYEKSGALTNYTIESISPSELQVFVDQKTEKSFDVVNSCTFKNSDNTKYPKIELDQSKKTVDVSGPESLINEIASVEVHGEFNKEGNFKKDLIFRDSENNELNDAYFTTSFSSVEVTAELLPISTVNLKVDLKNKPDGVTAQPVITPSAVKIAGKQEELDKIQKGLTVASLDFADLKNEYYKETFTLTPPDDCMIIADDKESTAPTKANVSLDLGLYSDTTVTKKIAYSKEGYTYDFSTGEASVSTSGEVSVTICGDEDEIKDITSDDIKLTVDFSDNFKSKINELKSGESVAGQDIKLKFELDSSYTKSWVYGQYTVKKVTVTKK